MPRLNSLPHIIAVYASQWSSPSTTQHSLPGGRYALPGPDLHRLEHASLLGAPTRYLFPSVLVRVKFVLMTRLASMVVSGLPHHVTQRGNRREPIFFEDGDQEIYRDLLGEQTRKADVEVWLIA